MDKFQCDICQNIVNREDAFFLGMSGINEENQMDNSVWYGHTCKSCGKNVLALFKNPIDIDKDWKKQFKQVLKNARKHRKGK